MTWVEQVLASTEGSESPRKYYYWSALAAIAAVCGNKLYLDKFYYKLYPNIYVLLVGKSGLRKGPPVALAKSLVAEVNNTRIIAGRSSIEAIIKDLATAVTSKNGGPPIMDARAMLVSSEFASFIIQNDQALTILTDLYDGHYNPEWVNKTKSGGDERLKNPCITLIGASNEVHFKDAIPDNALGGGFIARTFVIHETRKAAINSLTSAPEGLVSIPRLAEYLKEIGKKEGQFIWSREGKELYDAWYHDFSESSPDDDTGTLDRLHDSILKVAMLISLSRKLDLVLERDDIGEAIRECTHFVAGSRKVTMGAQGKSVSREGTAVVLKFLLTHPDHRVTKTKLLQKFWGHFNADELKVIIDSLIIAKAVRVETKQESTGRGLGHVEDWVILEPKVLENYEKLQKEN